MLKRSDIQVDVAEAVEAMRLWALLCQFGTTRILESRNGVYSTLITRERGSFNGAGQTFTASLADCAVKAGLLEEDEP